MLGTSCSVDFYRLAVHMLHELFILFIIGPVVAAAALTAFPRWPALQRRLSVACIGGLWLLSLASLFYVWSSGIVVLRMGNWPPPFGIILVADALSMTMVGLNMTVALAVSLFSLASIDTQRQEHFYFPLFLILLMGVNGAFLTGDLFNLFVFFEIVLIASFALLVLGSEPGQLRETIKYLVLNLLASTFFLIALAVTYRSLGTLNMADLALKIQAAPDSPLLTVLALLFLFVFGSKAAIFPLYFWLPGPYFQPPAGMSAFFGGMLTKVGVYAIFRTFTLLFRHDPALTHELILVLAAVSMLLGVFGALSQVDMKRILSYHIISQIGYLMLGIGLLSRQALAGVLFFMVPYVLSKSALFLIAGVVQRVTGTTSLKIIGGLQSSSWPLSGLFLIAALSLAGIPPLAGFFSKFIVLQAGVEAARYGYAGIGLVGGLLTLASMLKIWNGVFWGPEQGERRPVALKPLLPGIMLLVAGIVWIGLFPGVLYSVAEVAARQAYEPRAYIEAVLGPAAGP